MVMEASCFGEVSWQKLGNSSELRERWMVLNTENLEECLFLSLRDLKLRQRFIFQQDNGPHARTFAYFKFLSLFS